MLNQEVFPLSGSPLSWLRSIATCHSWQDSSRRRDSWNWWGQVGTGVLVPSARNALASAQWFSVRWFDPSGNTWQGLETFLVVPTWEDECYWHLVSRRPGMLLLNFFQCTGQPSDREWSGLKWQSCWGWATLPWTFASLAHCHPGLDLNWSLVGWVLITQHKVFFFFVVVLSLYYILSVYIYHLPPNYPPCTPYLWLI